MRDFHSQLSYLQSRKIETIFIGGGTPSLLSADFYRSLFEVVLPHCQSNVEITLEANPGTIDFESKIVDEQSKFHTFREVGINRLSLGIQTLNDEHLQQLGRVHTAQHAINAIELAQSAGFTNFNTDLMFGLPNQAPQQALEDLSTIIQHHPTHISWYQLTIEPNTHFYRRPPQLPDDDLIADMQQAGIALLNHHGYPQYEISAYSTQPCQHNLNYWRFGDYIGIGAGAHGKVTLEDPWRIIRTENAKHPKLYMDSQHQLQAREVGDNAVFFECMLNLCRLISPQPIALIQSRTNLSPDTILTKLAPLAEDGFLTLSEGKFELTDHGRRFANDLLERLLDA